MDAVKRWGRNRVVLGAVVVLLVAAGLMISNSLRASNVSGATGASLPILAGPGVRFRIVGEAQVQPNPAAFVEVNHVAATNQAITNVVLQNPQGDAGIMRIQIGHEILLEENLANLRDQHYPIPLQVKAGEAVVVAVSCQLPGSPQPPNGKCRPSASFFG